MILNCCILEDEAIYSDHLTKLLKQWKQGKDCDLSIDVYRFPSELYPVIHQISYDIIFLDIMLDSREAGIETAKKLRMDGFSGDLVFLTNFQDYVFEGYPVHALDYLLKPASCEKINGCMDQVLKRVTNGCFFYRARESVLQVRYDNILYFSSLNHATEVVTIQSRYGIQMTLKSLSSTLPKQFVQCHKSSIVNVFHIERMNHTELTLSNQEKLPIGRTYLRQLQQDVISLMQERRSVRW